jgi:hypothetical protein
MEEGAEGTPSAVVSVFPLHPGFFRFVVHQPFTAR